MWRSPWPISMPGAPSGKVSWASAAKRSKTSPRRGCGWPCIPSGIRWWSSCAGRRPSRRTRGRCRKGDKRSTTSASRWTISTRRSPNCARRGSSSATRHPGPGTRAVASPSWTRRARDRSWSSWWSCRLGPERRWPLGGRGVEVYDPELRRRLMRQTIAVPLVLVVLVAFAVPVAQAGTSTDVALGLASFAVFNQLFAPAFHARRGYRGHIVVREPVVIYRAAPVYAYPGYAYPSYAYPSYAYPSYAYPSAYPVYPSQYAVVQPPAPMATVVQYPHGRYE